MKKPILISTIALTLFPLEFRGDDQVRSVQEELRRRNLYFGDIDGRRSGEFSEALWRYQKRKGFAASGAEDRNTLRSMGLVARQPGEPAPKELEWPEEPVLKSDAALAAPAAIHAVSVETGVSAGVFSPTHAVQPPSEKDIARASVHPQRVSTKTPLPARASRDDPRLAPANLVLFAKNYVRSLSDNELQEQLHFYGDRVKYFHSGTIDRRIIEHSLRDYVRRWPSRHYTIGEEIDYAPLRGRGQIVLTFRVHFKLKGHGEKAEGTTENRVVINAATSDPRIVSIEEQRVKQ